MVLIPICRRDEGEQITTNGSYTNLLEWRRCRRAKNGSYTICRRDEGEQITNGSYTNLLERRRCVKWQKMVLIPMSSYDGEAS